ncbi:MAG: 3'-5' exonuclease, partial [Bdellovibrionota bacterium]
SIGQIRVGEVEATDGVTIVREFLSRMALEAQEEEEDKKDEKEKDKNQVTLLTLHGSKGLEFPAVFLVGMEEGFLPHKRTIEGAEDLSEERRLCYVGITRARDHLILSRVRNRIRYGKPVPRYRSRFLEEVPKELIVLRDESTSPDLSNEQARQAHEDKVKGFLAGIRANLMKK